MHLIDIRSAKASGPLQSVRLIGCSRATLFLCRRAVHGHGIGNGPFLLRLVANAVYCRAHYGSPLRVAIREFCTKPLFSVQIKHPVYIRQICTFISGSYTAYL